MSVKKPVLKNAFAVPRDSVKTMSFALLITGLVLPSVVTTKAAAIDRFSRYGKQITDITFGHSLTYRHTGVHQFVSISQDVHHLHSTQSTISI